MVDTAKYKYQVKTIIKLTKKIKEGSREVVLGTHIYICIVKNQSELFEIKMQNWKKIRIQISVLCHTLLIRMILEKSLVVILILNTVIPWVSFIFSIFKKNYSFIIN